jgi:serine/threonine protein kinase
MSSPPRLGKRKPVLHGCQGVEKESGMAFRAALDFIGVCSASIRGREELRVVKGPATRLVTGTRNAYFPPEMSRSIESKKPLKMVTCAGCGAKVFISGDLAPLATVPCTKCEHPLMMPLRLRQFELLSAIASGGMGTVYRAFDTTLEREVAVKLMRQELAEDPQALESFYREARACAALNHTNIIHIYTFDESNGHRYLVMELADCGSLDGRIELEQRLPELGVLDIGIKVASALDTALKHDLLHRDIKPGNILFNADGEPKLVDFGLARKIESDTPEETVWGTPYYIAPEKIKREREDFLSDMYSLAGTLYHALTGHVPFEARSSHLDQQQQIDEIIAAHIHTPLTPPNHVVPEVTQPTSDALVKAMAKSPSDRFQSYDEFIMALTTARSQYLVQHFRNQNRGGAGGDRPAGVRGWWRR